MAGTGGGRGTPGGCGTPKEGGTPNEGPSEGGTASLEEDALADTLAAISPIEATSGATWDVCALLVAARPAVASPTPGSTLDPNVNRHGTFFPPADSKHCLYLRFLLYIYTHIIPLYIYILQADTPLAETPLHPTKQKNMKSNKTTPPAAADAVQPLDADALAGAFGAALGRAGIGSALLAAFAARLLQIGCGSLRFGRGAK